LLTVQLLRDAYGQLGIGGGEISREEAGGLDGGGSGGSSV
jgi:hypothetical protein